MSDCPITNITIEWTQLVLIGVQQTGEVTAISFIATKQKYVYMEIGSRKYATLVIENKKQSRGRSADRSIERTTIIQRIESPITKK